MRTTLGGGIGGGGGRNVDFHTGGAGGGGGSIAPAGSFFHMGDRLLPLADRSRCGRATDTRVKRLDLEDVPRLWLVLRLLRRWCRSRLRLSRRLRPWSRRRLPPWRSWRRRRLCERVRRRAIVATGPKTGVYLMYNA